MLLRPQLCNYECEVEFDTVDDAGYAVITAIHKKCSRHEQLSFDELVVAIRQETDLHNDAIENGIDSQACFINDAGELQWLS